MPLDDLVYDPDLSTELRVHDIEASFHLMLLGPSRRDLSDFQLERLERSIHRALPNLEFIRGRFEVPELKETFTPLFDSITEVATAVGELAGSQPMGKSPFWLVESVKIEIEKQSSVVLSDSATLSQVFEIAASSLDIEQGALWQSAMKSLDSAVGDLGLERQELFRDSRTHLNDLVALPSYHPTPIAKLVLAWLSWKRRINPDDVLPLFESAYTSSKSSSPFIHWLSGRHLAYIQHDMGMITEAFSTIASVLPLRLDGQTLLEAFFYAIKAGKNTEAVAFCKRCTQLSPLYILPMLAMLEVDW